MKNGISKANKFSTFNNLELDSLLNNNYNHSSYYKMRKFRNTPIASNKINSSMLNFNLNLPFSHINQKYSPGINLFNDNVDTNVIHSTSNILNNLRYTIQNTQKILDNNRKYLINDKIRPLKLSKSVKLKENKKLPRKRKNKKKEISLESETISQKLEQEKEEDII